MANMSLIKNEMPSQDPAVRSRNFDEVALILQKAEEKYGSSLKDKVGVCLDTCHIWDGGYDIVNNLDDVLAEFDKKIGGSTIFS